MKPFLLFLELRKAFFVSIRNVLPRGCGFKFAVLLGNAQSDGAHCCIRMWIEKNRN